MKRDDQIAIDPERAPSCTVCGKKALWAARRGPICLDCMREESERRANITDKEIEEIEAAIITGMMAIGISPSEQLAALDQAKGRWADIQKRILRGIIRQVIVDRAAKDEERMRRREAREEARAGKTETFAWAMATAHDLARSNPGHALEIEGRPGFWEVVAVGHCVYHHREFGHCRGFVQRYESDCRQMEAA